MVIYSAEQQRENSSAVHSILQYGIGMLDNLVNTREFISNVNERIVSAGDSS